jgi:hypothetical protein
VSGNYIKVPSQLNNGTPVLVKWMIKLYPGLVPHVVSIRQAGAIGTLGKSAPSSVLVSVLVSASFQNDRVGPNAQAARDLRLSEVVGSLISDHILMSN